MKRQREQLKRERQQAKLERRAQRKNAKQNGQADDSDIESVPGVNPDSEQ